METAPPPLAEDAPAPPVRPVAAPERIAALDVLRGVAVLGILLMNILSFGLPDAAANNPLLLGDAQTANVACWLVSQIFFEGKLRTIFSMLFGAGAYLLVDRALKRGAGIETADVYTRRNLWLMAFGMIHAYFLWVGDILFYYGAVGLMLLPFRKLPAWGLYTLGGLLLAVATFVGILENLGSQVIRARGESAEAAAKRDERLSDEQQRERRAWQEKQKEVYPPREELEKEIKSRRADYWTQFFQRAGKVVAYESTVFYQYIFFDVAGMMLIGMGLLKRGVLSGERGDRFYLHLMIWGYGIGIPLNALVGVYGIQANFDPLAFSGVFMGTYQVGRLAVALGHIALVMRLCRRGAVPRLRRALAAVGRTALSNYLLETLICTTLFEGWGFGLFGSLERYQLFGVVVVVWAVSLVVSPLWLRYFRFGPAEWVWRALTYWRLPPLRVREPVAA